MMMMVNDINKWTIGQAATSRASGVEVARVILSATTIANQRRAFGPRRDPIFIEYRTENGVVMPTVLLPALAALSVRPAPSLPKP